jgi:hypothetical protein
VKCSLEESEREAEDKIRRNQESCSDFSQNASTERIISEDF